MTIPVVHLQKVNFQYGGQGTSLKIGGNSGGPECQNSNQEMQEGEILSADVNIQIDRQNKHGLKLQGKGEAQDNERGNTTPAIEGGQGQNTQESIHGIALAPDGRIEHNGGQEEYDCVGHIKDRAEERLSLPVLKQRCAGQSQKKVKKNGDILVKMYHIAWKTGKQNDDRLV